jgi:hypothetical protein
MPLLSTLSNAGIQSYGNRGIITGGSAFYDSIYDSLSVSPGTAFQYGTGDFTIEMWFYPTTANGIDGYGVTLFAQRGPNYNSQRYLFLFLYPNRQVFLQVPGNDFFVGTSTLANLNAWNHVALVRRSGQMQIFLNGYPGTARTNTTNYTNTSYVPIFGSLGFNVNYAFAGYLSNMRIAKSAYYTIPFQPDRTPFTRTSQGATNVQLLLNFKNAAGLLTDSSANNFTVFNSTLSLVQYNALTPFNVPYVPNPLVTPVTVTVTPSTLTPSEGSTITFNVVGTNTPNGTYYYVVEEPIGAGTITSADFTSGALSGTFSISGNSGSFPITVSRDLTTEGDETFIVSVRSTSISGQILGTSDEIAITDSSLTPVFTFTPSSINEGTSDNFTVQNIGPDGTYFWTILNGTTTNADFLATSGSFTVSGSTGGIDDGTGSFGVTALPDRTTEGSQTFQVQVRSGSVSGPVIITSSISTINDTSLTPAFTVTPASISEGSSDTFTVNNLGSAGFYYWTILNGTTTNADFVATSGFFTTSTLNGSGSFSVSAALDYTTEGSQTFQVQVREDSIAGPVLVTSSSVTIGDASTTVTATPSPTTISEGGSTTISVSATSIPTGTYFWTVLNGTTTNADFTAASGSFGVFLNSGNFTVTAATLDGSEGTEFFQVQVREGSTSGTVIATTGTITISLSAT